MSYEFFVKDNPLQIEFFSKKAITVFSIVCIACLIAMFPGFYLKKTLRLPHSPSELSIFYLSHLAEQEPNHFLWRYSLIKEQIQLGQWDAAKKQIALLSHFKNQQKMVAFLNWQLSLQEAFALIDSNKKKIRFAELRKKLPELLKMDFDPYFLWRMGEAALQLEDEKSALIFLGQANQKEPLHDPNELMNIGKIALAVKAYQASANFYFLAAQQSGDYLIKRQAIRLGLQSLQAGELQSQGIPVIKQLNYQYFQDREFLIFLSRYALSAGDPVLASDLVKKALFMHGEFN